ncbi:hypothetical protein EXS74_00985 [Candidatus Woesearchaeota archaeon]|nr:hypothetical protein [Candidatus Woesearchaeota archaeon]
MSSCYRILNINGEPSIPEVSISLLELLLGVERSVMKERSKRSILDYLGEVKDGIQGNGLVDTLLTEGIYYPFVSVVYKIF